MRIFAIGAVLVLLPALAAGQTLYRCKDAKGVSSYQQTPCPTAAQEAGEVQYQRQADRPHWTPEIQAQRDYQAALERQQQAEMAAYAAATAPPAPRRTTRSTNPMSADAEAMRRMEHMAGSREGRAMLRAQHGRSPLVEDAMRQARTPPPPPDISPKQIRDQRGNTYTQPHGSAFAQDSKTGKQCFVNGAFIHC